MLHASCARRLDRVVLHELVDEVVAGEAANRQHQQPHDEHAERERTELEPAAPLRQPDGERGDRKRDDPHPVSDRAQHLRRRLRRLELALLHDRDPSRGLGEPLRDLSDDRHLVADLDHERAQIEHDRAALGLDEGRVVVEEAHELALRPGRHLDPHRLHARPLEHRIGCPIGARARDAGQNRSEPLQGGRQPLGDRRLDVDVLEQRVDRLGRDLCADLVVLDHVARDRLEALLVESGVLDVEGDHPDEREQDRQDGQHTGAYDAQTGSPSGLWGSAGLVHRVSLPSGGCRRVLPRLMPATPTSSLLNSGADAPRAAFQAGRRFGEYVRRGELRLCRVVIWPGCRARRTLTSLCGRGGRGGMPRDDAPLGDRHHRLAPDPVQKT